MTDKLKELAFSKWRGKPEVEAKRETMCWSEIFYAGWEAALAVQAPAGEWDAKAEAKSIYHRLGHMEVSDLALKFILMRLEHAYAAGRASAVNSKIAGINAGLKESLEMENAAGRSSQPVEQVRATNLDELCKCGQPKRAHIGKPLGMNGHWYEPQPAEPRDPAAK